MQGEHVQGVSKAVENCKISKKALQELKDTKEHMRKGKHRVYHGQAQCVKWGGKAFWFIL